MANDELPGGLCSDVGSSVYDIQETKWAVTRHRLEVAICGQQRKFVANAQTSDECIDRSYLNTSPSTSVPQLGRLDMILDIGCHHGQ